VDGPLGARDGVKHGHDDGVWDAQQVAIGSVQSPCVCPRNRPSPAPHRNRSPHFGFRACQPRL